MRLFYTFTRTRTASLPYDIPPVLDISIFPSFKFRKNNSHLLFNFKILIFIVNSIKFLRSYQRHVGVCLLQNCNIDYRPSIFDMNHSKNQNIVQNSKTQQFWKILCGNLKFFDFQLLLLSNIGKSILYISF